MIRVVHAGSRIRMLTFYPSRIPDLGVKKAPDPGSGSATLMAIECSGNKTKKAHPLSGLVVPLTAPMVAQQMRCGFFLSTASSFIPTWNRFILGVAGSFLKHLPDRENATIIFLLQDATQIISLTWELLTLRYQYWNKTYLSDLYHNNGFYEKTPN
jgi:hypothetical protein